MDVQQLCNTWQEAIRKYPNLDRKKTYEAKRLGKQKLVKDFGILELEQALGTEISSISFYEPDGNLAMHAVCDALQMFRISEKFFIYERSLWNMIPVRDFVHKELSIVGEGISYDFGDYFACRSGDVDAKKNKKQLFYKDWKNGMKKAYANYPGAVKSRYIDLSEEEEAFVQATSDIAEKVSVETIKIHNMRTSNSKSIIAVNIIQPSVKSMSRIIPPFYKGEKKSVDTFLKAPKIETKIHYYYSANGVYKEPNERISGTHPKIEEVFSGIDRITEIIRKGIEDITAR